MIPSVRELTDQNLANLEGALGQTAPIAPTSFLRVMAAVLAMALIGLYKFAGERIIQVSTLTATGDDLDLRGANVGVYRNAAVAAVLTATIHGPGLTIPVTQTYKSDSTGLEYAQTASFFVNGIATFSVRALTPGAASNLAVDETLTMSPHIEGVSSDTVADRAVVTGVTTLGADRELDADYRVRILAAERGVSGGGNAYDYQAWATAVSGVKRAFPYSGRPYGSGAASAPRHRTVYVEAEGVDPTPTAPLLASVREAITIDPVTSRARQPLGATDETLFVEPIVLTEFFITIRDLVADPAVNAQAVAAISDALDGYFSGVTPFIEGIDAEVDRADLITDLTVSASVQAVLSEYGGTASSVAFGLTPGASLSGYRLPPGRLATLGGVNYV